MLRKFLWPSWVQKHCFRLIFETFTLKLSSWAFKKWKKRCARSTFRFARTLELPRLYILSDKEEFAMQLWFKSAKENENRALCFTALDNSLLYSPFLQDSFLLWLLKTKNTKERLIMWNVIFWEGKKENEAELGSDRSISCFKEGKSCSISGIHYEISEQTPSLSKNIIFPQTNTLILSLLSVVFFF